MMKIACMYKSLMSRKRISLQRLEDVQIVLMYRFLKQTLENVMTVFVILICYNIYNNYLIFKLLAKICFNYINAYKILYIRCFISNCLHKIDPILRTFIGGFYPDEHIWIFMAVDRNFVWKGSRYSINYTFNNFINCSY